MTVLISPRGIKHSSCRAADWLNWYQLSTVSLNDSWLLSTSALLMWQANQMTSRASF